MLENKNKKTPTSHVKKLARRYDEMATRQGRFIPQSINTDFMTRNIADIRDPMFGQVAEIEPLTGRAPDLQQRRITFGEFKSTGDESENVSKDLDNGPTDEFLLVQLASLVDMIENENSKDKDISANNFKLINKILTDLGESPIQKRVAGGEKKNPKQNKVKDILKSVIKKRR